MIVGTGDWRVRDKLMIYVKSMPTSEEEEEESLVRKIATGLCYTLYPSCIHKWCAHRWRGMDLVLDDIGLGDSVNGSFSAAYLS